MTTFIDAENEARPDDRPEAPSGGSSAFADRHIGADQQQVATMLRTVGLDSLPALVGGVIPPVIR